MQKNFGWVRNSVLYARAQNMLYLSHFQRKYLPSSETADKRQPMDYLQINKGLLWSTISQNQIFDYTRCIRPKRVLSWRDPIFASLHPGNTARFKEMLQRWRAVGNTVSDLTGPRFEPQTSRSKDKRVTVRKIIFNL